MFLKPPGAFSRAKAVGLGVTAPIGFEAAVPEGAGLICSE